MPQKKGQDVFEGSRQTLPILKVGADFILIFQNQCLAYAKEHIFGFNPMRFTMFQQNSFYIAQ